MVKAFGWVSCVLFLGCLSRLAATATGPAQPPRPEGCDFEILTTAPPSGFIEIGTIDVVVEGDDGTSNLATFKKHIAPQVCHLGGDAALALASGGSYHYLKATVLKRSEGATPVGAATSAADDKHGCEYDTQCKGDRVCIGGSCQEPAPTAPTASSPAP